MSLNVCTKIHTFIPQVSSLELSPGLSALYLHAILSKRDYLLSNFPTRGEKEAPPPVLPLVESYNYSQNFKIITNGTVTGKLTISHTRFIASSEITLPTHKVRKPHSRGSVMDSTSPPRPYTLFREGLGVALGTGT